MNKLSPQKEYILNFLRKGGWHCGREWLGRVKDDRKRISEMEGYMFSKGYVIKGEPCKGKICGVPNCPLYKRRAEKITTHSRPPNATLPRKIEEQTLQKFIEPYPSKEALLINQAALKWWDEVEEKNARI